MRCFWKAIRQRLDRLFKKTSGKKPPKVTKTLPNDVLLPVVLKMLEEYPTATIPLKGISMRPFLEDTRDKAVLTKLSRPAQKGDPVLAEVRPGFYVIHRIVAIDGDQVTLRGDGNLATEQCRTADIRAAVVGFYRKGRKTMDRTDGLKWRIYSRVWTALFPVRRYLLAFYRRIWIKLFGPI